MTKLIDIKNATVYRGDTKVFDKFSLSIEKDANTAIIGPNGAGKTTLLKLLNREIYPMETDESHVQILGRDRWNVWELRKILGVISHDLQTGYMGEVRGFEVIMSGFFASMGIWEHHEVSKEQILQAKQIVQELDVEDIQGRIFSSLSTGQQRRFLLGRALIHDPDTLVLDEPTSGLDLKAMFQYMQVIRSLMQKGRTVILVTHHIHEIPPEIDRVVLMSEGKVVDDGPKEKMLTNDRLSELYNVPVSVVTANGYYQTLPG